MSEFNPMVTLDREHVEVRLRASRIVRSVAVECVLDMTDFGDVIGIEVLDLKQQMGGGVIDESPQDAQVRWGYDPEIDAYYLHLLRGTAANQKSATATISVDADGRIVRLDVPLPPLS